MYYVNILNDRAPMGYVFKSGNVSPVLCNYLGNFFYVSTNNLRLLSSKELDKYLEGPTYYYCGYNQFPFGSVISSQKFSINENFMLFLTDREGKESVEVHIDELIPITLQLKFKLKEWIHF